MASVLQVATIKDQGGNNNAIEIANTSANVTINNLAGGAIGSAVTFPTGHIGIKSYTVENLNYWNGSSTSSSGVELFTGSGGFTSSAITPVSSSSKFFVTFTLNATTDEHDYDKCAGIIIKRKIGSGSYAESDLVGTSSGSRWRTSFTVKGLAFNDGHNGIPYTISGIDAPSHSGSTVTYQVQYVVQDSNSALHCNGAINNGNSTGAQYARHKSIMTIVEVA